MNKLINKNRLLKTFFKLAMIDSESGNEKDFAEYMLMVGRKFADKTWKDKYNNIYIQVDGEGEPLMLNTHMDTVSPGKGVKPKIDGDYIVSDGTTILGADSKAGIAAMVEMLTLIKQGKVTSKPLLISLTCNEESGIPTVEHIKSNIKECVVPDRGTPLGEIIVKSPYAQVFEVVVRGKSVYATTDFEKGRHAILAATEMIQSLPIGNYDSVSTSNIGVIKGGTVTSVVPNECSFKGNCYSYDKKSIKYFFNILRRVVSSTDKKYITKSRVIMHEYFGGFEISRTDELVVKTKDAIAKTGLKPCFKVYKAVSNANILNSIGIKSVLISTGVENQHTVKERILINNLVKLTEIIFNLAVTKLA